MSTLIGYARVSTIEQDPALQLDALKAAGCRRVFTDHASGATDARPQLAKCLDFLVAGDVLVVWRLDRLGRSLRDLINLMNQLDERGIQFRSVTEAIDTTTATGRMMYAIFGALAEFERELIRERTKAGLAAARARGRNGGRPRVMTPRRLQQAQQLRADGVTLDEIANTLGVGRSTVVRALATQTSSSGRDAGA